MFERRQERLRLLSDYQDDDDSDIEEMINEATEAAQAAGSYTIDDDEIQI